MSGKKPLKAIFVTGTDTAVGKTIVTGLLARYILESGYRVITQKWMQTGCSGFSSDIKTHLKIMGKDKSRIKNYLTCVCPYAFKPACSPHLAAEIEGRRIDADKIKTSFKLLCKSFDFVLVEGVGGVLVPFNKKQMVIDVARDLHLPVLVVVGNGLGAINHALLAIEALRQRKIHILGMVFNNLRRQNQKIITDNPRIIKLLTKEEVFGALDWQDNYDRLYKNFLPVGNKIWRRISGLRKT